MDAACPRCGFTNAWDGTSCNHCVPAISPQATATPIGRFMRRLATLLIIGAIAASAFWFCWPGRFSAYNIWRIRPGMTLKQVESLLGRTGEELTEKQLPVRQGDGKVVSGEKYYIWHADANGWWRGDYLIVSFESGVVKQTYYWEVPLS